MIILFGLAGSGKGTQGKALSEIFGWRWLSVGQAIRDTGEYEELTKAGKLVPDEDVVKIMNKAIKKAEDEGFDVILDGYPRDLAQAEWMMANMREKIDGAIMLEVPKEELLERLMLRGRDDDKSEEAIRQRFETFEQNICSILPLFSEKGIEVRKVSGVGKVAEVTERLAKVMEELAPKAKRQDNDVNGGEIERSYGE